MSTRAVYSFKDQYDTHHVYKHYDGYPSGACGFIENAKSKAWHLPRFEADEFAAAFVAANKEGSFGGDVRLTKGPSKHSDIEYQYLVTFDEKKRALIVTAFNVKTDWDSGKQTKKQFFKGTLEAFSDKFSEKEAA